MHSVVRARIESAVDLIDLGLEGDAHFFETIERGFGVFGHLVNQRGVGAEVTALQSLFCMEFGAVLDALLGLTLVVGRVEGAARNGGVAADVGHLFENHDVLHAVLRGGNGYGKAGAARTDDHDLVRFIPLLRKLARIFNLRGRDARERNGGTGKRRTQQMSTRKT